MSPSGERPAYTFPNTYLYSAGHLWLMVDDLAATVGTTEFLFDLIHREYFFVQLPQKDQQLTRGQVIGAIDALKVALPIVAPLSGAVTEVNPEVQRDAQTLVRAPYTRGWLYKMELSEPIELRRLMRIAEYQEFVFSKNNLDFIRQ